MKCSKTLLTVFGLVLSIFLFLSITRWNILKSVHVQELREIIKVTGIEDVIEWNTGYLLLFCLMVFFLVLCLRHNRKHCLQKGKAFRNEWQKTAEYHDPAYSALPGNIHCQTPSEND